MSETIATIVPLASPRPVRPCSDKCSCACATEAKPGHALSRELPAPVRRYFDAAFVADQPWVRGARLRQEGQFMLSPGRWRPFTATHRLSVSPPGFSWDARIRLAPGLEVRVRDSLVGGVGTMRATLLGVIPLAHQAGTPDVASGALHRWLAEAAWCPVALLPEAGVRWSALDSTSARATVSAGAVSASLDFHFGADGLIERVFTMTRARAIKGGTVLTPWEGIFRHYEARGGMRIPIAGEVAWLLLGGRQPYWRGRILEAAFD
jgi:hypothetical protein